MKELVGNILCAGYECARLSPESCLIVQMAGPHFVQKCPKPVRLGPPMRTLNHTLY